MASWASLVFFGHVGGDLKRVGVVGIWLMSSERVGDVNAMVSSIFWAIIGAEGCYRGLKIILFSLIFCLCNI